MQQGHFSLVKFFIKRIKRIIPALLFVMTSTSIIAWFLLIPKDLIRYAKSLMASLLMIPNMAAWQIRKDYFAIPEDAMPLLHLWSIGVEEQFYILFPFILITLYKLRVKW